MKTKKEEIKKRILAYKYALDLVNSRRPMTLEEKIIKSESVKLLELRIKENEVKLDKYQDMEAAENEILEQIKKLKETIIE
jgi:hypothetical protein